MKCDKFDFDKTIKILELVVAVGGIVLTAAGCYKNKKNKENNGEKLELLVAEIVEEKRGSNNNN